jgi:hypothetical protein
MTDKEWSVRRRQIAREVTIFWWALFCIFSAIAFACAYLGERVPTLTAIFGLVGLWACSPFDEIRKMRDEDKDQ